MPQMTTKQARIIDPILTEIALGFEPNQSSVANVLFPSVNVKQRGGRVVQFGREQFDVPDTARAPGALIKRVQPGYGSMTYALIDRALEGFVPIELLSEGQGVPVSLAEQAVRLAQSQMQLEKEAIASQIARNNQTYAQGHTMTLSGDSRWTSENSNPMQQINEAKEKIRKATGKRPNKMVVGPAALTALRNHKLVQERLSITSLRVPATLEHLEALLEIEDVVEGEAVQNITNNGKQEFADVWGGDVVLAYVAPKSLQDMGSQSFGYTYQLEGYPFVEPGRWDANVRSMVYPYIEAYQVVAAMPSAGFLIQTAA